MSWLAALPEVVAVVVDPVSLSVGAVVAAMVVKAAEKTGETAAGAGAAALGRVLRWLRERFSHNDDTAATALAQVEEVPDSPSRVKVLAEVIDRRAAADAGFKAGLEALVREAKAGGADMKAVSQIAEGIGHVQIANIENSTITVNQGPLPARPAPGKPSPDAGPTDV